MNTRSTWGVVLFLLALLVAAGVYAAWAGAADVLQSRTTQRTLIIVAVALALITGILSHVSYPRVHSLRVTMYGYGVAVTTVFFNALVLTQSAGDAMPFAAAFVSYAIIILLTAVVIMVPAFVGYRATMLVAEITVAVIGLLFVGLLAPFGMRAEMVARLQAVAVPGTAEFWGFVVASVLVVVLSLLQERQSFGLGGMHSGAVAIMASGWLAIEAPLERHMFVLTVLPFYLLIAILAHWLFRVENRASYDPLLRIYNRSFCDSVIQGRSRMNVRPPFSIALIDLDHFKSVNDTHGHDAGDAVLVAAAQRVQKSVIPDGTVARYGGEELIVFFPHTSLDAAQSILERTREAVSSSPIEHRGKSIPITMSAGVAERRDRRQEIDEVLRAADGALYTAKDAGRNRVVTGMVPR